MLEVDGYDNQNFENLLESKEISSMMHSLLNAYIFQIFTTPSFHLMMSFWHQNELNL